MAIFKSRTFEKNKTYIETVETWRSDGTAWEEEPKPLATKGFAYWFVVVLDVVLCLIPVCFIG